MMKFAFLSDINGNATALEAVLNDLHIQKIDRIYVLGNLCLRGPEPKRVLKLLQASNAHVLKGGMDDWLVNGITDQNLSHLKLAALNEERQWTLARLSEEDLAYLNARPNECIIDEGFEQIIHAFHATPTDLHMTVLADDTAKMEEAIMQRDEADTYIYGHTGRPFIRTLYGKTVMNVGSVGMPLDGHPLASYITLTYVDGRYSAAIHRTPYNREHVVEIYKQSDYPNIEKMSTMIYYAVPSE
ncbi:metallophosphoesterase family protein [Shouchella lonarensis]|uniref:Predicted phosphodiesterase n=1 Tax=Shouchella lonarensis TaxID=1464122 RepID=A0A1G6HB95_9BACI|nr:metallophosphoesterase family protein [Shouchella lonarensis]SDB91530.1 Predicted phosphodiesterase [Shouchella lonarensis]